MAKNAKAILVQQKEILVQQRTLERLMNELSQKEVSYKESVKRANYLNSERDELEKSQSKTQKRLVFAIARNVSLSLLLDDDRSINEDSLISEEVLKKLSFQTRSEIEKLNSELQNNSGKISSVNSERRSLKKSIDKIDNKHQRLKITKRKNEKALKVLKKDKLKYKRALGTYISQKNALQGTLSSLNIIKDDELKKQIAKEKRDAEKKKKKKWKKKTTVSTPEQGSYELPKVRKLGSSYQRIKTKKYRGKKTIAPLDSYKVAKKYGTYKDPIYQIKIFNESVSLKPSKKGAKVKNVLNGKIIFAKNTPLLDNVVIIEHKNGMHTIYAHLSKISPNVKKGRKIRAGTVIGRVDGNLVFEVTQQNYHINPMQMIR
ncbi:MAG: peptidoglycan DD-metalloendopeptidase family protein [Helicobacteraceae bacterium]|nr:peptidoglycan DD-metalloendopeptidase family protein [Helicobacteraceae bacterium]